MKPMYPVVTVGSQSIPGNDSRHNKVESTNKSGGPSVRTRRMIPPSKRGGSGHSGQRVVNRASMGRGRQASGNPADRAGRVGSDTPDTRNPNGGGGVQTRPGREMPRQFGKDGKEGVVNDYRHARPKPGAGNTGGRMHKRIAGKFQQKSKFGGGPVSLGT